VTSRRDPSEVFPSQLWKALKMLGQHLFNCGIWGDEDPFANYFRVN
jgi:hypothetical protein